MRERTGNTYQAVSCLLLPAPSTIVTLACRWYCLCHVVVDHGVDADASVNHQCRVASWYQLYGW